MSWKSELVAVGKSSTNPLVSRIREGYRDIRFRTSLRGLGAQEIVLVHTMGKVGSTSVVASLKNSGIKIPVYHTHCLNAGNLYARLGELQAREQRVPNHLIVSQRLQEQISSGLGNKSWKIITLVREPISRNISAYFQNVERYIPGFSHLYSEGTVTMEEVVNVFMEEFQHDQPFDWFDLEIKSVFGLDVLAADFPHREGYQILRDGHVELLILKLETLDSCYVKALREFLGIEQPRLMRLYASKEKSYRHAYTEFLEAIDLPPSYIERLYSDRYTRHFYNDQEIEEFTKKWLRQAKGTPRSEG